MALAEYLLIISLIFVSSVFSNENGTCPQETDLLRRLGDTRFYIIHGNKRGNYVDQWGAEKECNKYNLTMARINNMRTFAIVGRLLEKLVLKHKLKDTWYWLPAYFTTNGHWYIWSGSRRRVQLQNFLYRKTRPVGIGAMVNYKNEYEIHRNDLQCLVVALPWFGPWEQSPSYKLRGHQFSFDEKPCNSVKARHAMCESKVPACNSTLKGAFYLTEDKTDYFEKGNWIIGDRQFIVNWGMRGWSKSVDYCRYIGMKLYEPTEHDEALIPFIKMWSRGSDYEYVVHFITYSTFWTNLMWHRKNELFEFKNYTKIPGISWKDFFDEKTGGIKRVLEQRKKTLEVEARGGDSKWDSYFHVSMALAYEFRGQTPCGEESINSSKCEWHFREFIPSSNENYHGVICSRNKTGPLTWDPRNIQNVDDLLNKTATLPFGYAKNIITLRSTYKQTFGSLVCPPGYRMVRMDNDMWYLIEPYYTDFKYDFFEDYWVVDHEYFNKNEDSNCTISSPNNRDGGRRKLVQVPCSEWHFYLCHLKPETRIKRLNVKVNPGIQMKWKEGPQKRTYPIIAEDALTARNQQDMDDTGVVEDELSPRAERWESTKYILGDFGCRYNIDTERVQVAIAADHTGSNYDAIPVFASKCKELLSVIKNIQPNTEFALTTHANWQQNVWKGHNDPEGCYKRLLNFTTDDESICRGIGNIQHMAGPLYPGWLENGLPAVAFLVADTKIGWLPEPVGSEETNVHRIVILMTDVFAKFHIDIPGNRTEFRADGTDTCSTSKPASRDFIGNFLKKRKILIIGLYNHIEPYHYEAYKQFFMEYDIPNVWTNFGNKNDWKYRVVDFTKNAVSKLMNCIYEDPPAYNTLGL